MSDTSYMQWRRKRQFSIAIIVLGPIIAALVLWWFLSRPEPTCFDGIKNQDEQGVDCGGVCNDLCQEDIPNPLVSWARSFNVSGEVYNIVALVEVPEDGLIANRVPYVFRLYDAEGLLIVEETRSVNIPPSGTLALFLPSIESKNREPVRATIDFPHDVEWTRVSKKSIDFNMIGRPQIRDGSFGTEVRLSAAHNGEQLLTDISLVAVLFDKEGNALHASQTYLESLSAAESTPLTFTWPEQLATQIDEISIFPMSYTVAQ